MAKQKINTAQLLDGKIYRRQGGSSTAWNTRGTTNYDVSASSVKVQVGSILVTSVDMVVTFPVAFSQVPLVFATTNGAGSANTYAIVNGSSTSGFNIRTINDAGSGITSEGVAWMAIGE